MPDAATADKIQPTIREAMGAVRRFVGDISGENTATGSGGAYVVASAQTATFSSVMFAAFRANHENPNAAPTLALGGLPARTIAYADGSTIPAGGIRAGQIVVVYADTANSRWSSLALPTTPDVGSVDGSRITLDGEATGGLAVKSATDWISLSPGTSGRVLTSRGPGLTPTYQDPAVGLKGMARLVCKINPGTAIQVMSGTPHTATISRLSKGNYRINVSPNLPGFYTVQLTTGGEFRHAVAKDLTSSSFTVQQVSVADPSSSEDVESPNYINVAVFG